MRTAFIEELTEQAKEHDDLFLVVGDLGYSVVEVFAEQFPDRFLNAGVAEQNMTGVAAGLASEGYRVFTYSIANFPTLRCLEQVRNDVCYHGLPVTVVAVGGGVAYGNLGYSHHAVQDLGIMRALPGMAVLAPGDPGETRECVRWLARTCRGPAYLRLGKAGEPDLHRCTGFETGPLRVRPGNGPVAIVATGSALAVATAAAERLEPIETAVFSCPLLAPTDAAYFAPLAAFPSLVVVEDHVRAGGLYELLSGLLPRTTALHPFSIPHQTGALVGSQEYLRTRSGISPSSVAEAVRALSGS